jgi:hypothetical protein
MAVTSCSAVEIVGAEGTGVGAGWDAQARATTATKGRVRMERRLGNGKDDRIQNTEFRMQTSPSLF